MLIAREFVAYLSRQVAKRLTPTFIETLNPQALAELFGGLSGAAGGLSVNPDGSNINPVALALLNFKLPDGRFLVPTPQTVDLARPLAVQRAHECSAARSLDRS